MEKYYYFYYILKKNRWYVSVEMGDDFNEEIMKVKAMMTTLGESMQCY